jgi:ArsR family transcriptional regulator
MKYTLGVNNMNYADYAILFKAMADETRLKIVVLLSKGELCACKILENFNITQPTLSYHMKILTECGLVDSRKDGSWMRYSLNKDTFAEVKKLCRSLELDAIQNKPENCNSGCCGD